MHRSAISSLPSPCWLLRDAALTNSLLLVTFLKPLINALLLGHINFLSDASGSWRRSWVTFDTRSCLLTVYSDNTEDQGIARIDTTRATFLYDLENDGHDDGLFKIWYGIWFCREEYLKLSDFTISKLQITTWLIKMQTETPFYFSARLKESRLSM